MRNSDVKKWPGALILALLLGLNLAWAQDPLKVGFVYVGPIGDAGWTFEHDVGRRQLVATLGERIETNYVESVAEGADAERVIRQLAADGNKVIFATSFGYMNPTLKVARRFPKTVFEHATGYKRAPNVGTYSARFYEGRYLTGLIAGRMSKSNIIGYVASFPIPEVVQGINAFTLGLRQINPKAIVKVVWVNTWYDPAKEREAAETLIAQGADIVNHHTDSPAVIQAAEENGVYAFGYDSDMSAFGPTAHLTASIVHWGGFYTKVVQQVLDGSWRSADVWGGIKDGLVDLAPYNKRLPKDVIALAEKYKAAIADGSVQVFRGPIKDRSGKVRVATGTTMSDAEILAFDWYVEGVQGSLPK